MSDGGTAGWQKLSVASGAVAAVLIPLALALVGALTSTALKEQETRGQFVTLAVSILQQSPTPENASVREWAIAVINRYSDVPLQQAAVQTLKESTSLPSVSSSAVSSTDARSAAAWEREAFTQLLAGQVAAAIRAFDAADASYPSYHSVYEIAQLLRRDAAMFSDDLARRKVLEKIVTDYTWGVPADLVAQLRGQIGK